VLARRERIALPSELTRESGSRLDPKSLQKGERDHLVTGPALWRSRRRTVIAPRSASMQILFLKAVFVFPVPDRRRHQGGADGSPGFIVRAVFPQGQEQHDKLAGDEGGGIN